MSILKALQWIIKIDYLYEQNYIYWLTMCWISLQVRVLKMYNLSASGGYALRPLLEIHSSYHWKPLFENPGYAPAWTCQLLLRKWAVITDCSEVFIERTSNLLVKAQVWSNYKHHSTISNWNHSSRHNIIHFTMCQRPNIQQMLASKYTFVHIAT